MCFFDTGVLLSGLYSFSALNPDCFICMTWDSPWYLVSITISGWYHHVWCILYTNDVIPDTICIYYLVPLVLPVLLNISTVMSHFPLQRHWFDEQTYLTPGSLCRRSWPKPLSKDFSRVNKIKKRTCQLYWHFVDDNNRSPFVSNDSQNGISCCQQAVIVYELN